MTLTAQLGSNTQSAMITVSNDGLLFLLRGGPSEISSVSNGSPVVPALAPPGTQVNVVQRGKGLLRLVNVVDNAGMQFTGSNGNTNTAFLNLPGPVALTALFGRPSGEVSFTMQSTRTFSERRNAGSYRWVYDVYDATRRLHWFGVYTFAGRLMFTYSAGGSSPLFYYVPAGNEDALFGKQVALRVRIAWSSSVAKLYLNDTLVQTSTFVGAAANWTAQSSMTIGATNTREMNGGYYFFDDQLANFQVK